MNVWDVDWHKVFVSDVALLELFIRGSLVYLCVFFIFRFIVKRVGASVALANILVVVLIADVVADGAMGGMESVTGAAVLALTVAFWNTAREYLEYHSPLAKRLLYSPPMPIIRNGEFLREPLRHHLLTEEEVMVQLRQQGEKDISVVREAYMENDGEISFIMKEKQAQ